MDVDEEDEDDLDLSELDDLFSDDVDGDEFDDVLATFEGRLALVRSKLGDVTRFHEQRSKAWCRALHLIPTEVFHARAPR